MQVHGTIIRLQIQRAPLKVALAQPVAGSRAKQRRYDPTPLLALPRVLLKDGGVCGEDGQLDVHHPRHPAGKNADVNGVSVGFSAHYGAMRRRFGPHLSDGIAGENILVQTDRGVEEEDLRDGLIVLTRDGRRVHLTGFLVAEPCVEFTHYALRCPPDSRSTPTVTEALSFLRAGMRGYYATYRGEPVRLEVGDRVLL
jgi:hypothetical protein